MKANGIKIHCVTQGKGIWSFFCTAFPSSGTPGGIRYLSSPGASGSLRPTCGATVTADKPADVESYGVGSLIMDVKGLIEAFGASKAHVVGHDWGGAVARFSPSPSPQRVEKLVVMNAPHPGIFAGNLQGNSRQILRSWYMFLLSAALPS